MKNIIKNLEFAESLINNDDLLINPVLYKFNRIYPFSNENTKACFAPFDLKNKNVLTVLSSSDQVFEIFLKGSRKIDAFDINPLTEEYYYLKLAALLEKIPKKEFLEFFCYEEFIGKIKNNSDCFNRKTFEKIEPNLSTNYTTFWKELYSKYSPMEIRGPQRIFNNDEKNRHILEKTLSYLEPKKYNYLQQHLNELSFSFIQSDIRELSSKLTDKYDFIYLSNIINYTDVLFGNNSLEKYKKIVLDLSKHLNPNGKIIVGYLYKLEKKDKTFPEYRKYREEVFGEQEFSYYYFPTIHKSNFDILKNEHDACLIYTKK